MSLNNVIKNFKFALDYAQEPLVINPLVNAGLAVVYARAEDWRSALRRRELSAISLADNGRDELEPLHVLQAELHRLFKEKHSRYQIKESSSKMAEKQREIKSLEDEIISLKNLLAEKEKERNLQSSIMTELLKLNDLNQIILSDSQQRSKRLSREMSGNFDVLKALHQRSEEHIVSAVLQLSEKAEDPTEDIHEFFLKIVKTCLYKTFSEAAAIANNEAEPNCSRDAQKELDILDKGAGIFNLPIPVNPFAILNTGLSLSLYRYEDWERDTLKPIGKCSKYLSDIQNVCNYSAEWFARYYCLVLSKFDRKQTQRFADAIVEVFIKTLLYSPIVKKLGKSRERLDYNILARDFAFEVIVSHERICPPREKIINKLKNEPIYFDDALWKGGVLLWENERWARYKFTHKKEDKSQLYAPIVLRQDDYPKYIGEEFIRWYTQFYLPSTRSTMSNFKSALGGSKAKDLLNYTNRHGFTPEAIIEGGWEKIVNEHYPLLDVQPIQHLLPDRRRARSRSWSNESSASTQQARSAEPGKNELAINVGGSPDSGSSSNSRRLGY